MSCQQFKPLLSAYVDKELVAVDSLRIRQHLFDCPSCAAEVKQLEGIRSLMLELPPAPEPRMDFEAFLVANRPQAPRKISLTFALAAVAIIATILAPAMMKSKTLDDNARLNEAISREVARDRMMAAESDPTEGAPLAHFAGLDTP